MNIFDEILDELKGIRAALAGGSVGDKGVTVSEKKASTTTSKKPAGPTLEQVQDKIRELVAADESHKTAIKAAVSKLGGQRAGDFESDPAKLAKLMDALNAMGDEAPASDDGDDDLL